jgi:hypothetical protein
MHWLVPLALVLTGNILWAVIFTLIFIFME